MDDCASKIVSEDYVDILTRYNPNEVGIREFLDQYCGQMLNERWAVLYVRKELAEPLNFGRYGYVTFPRIYTVLDTGAMSAAGITAVVNQPVLGLRGNGVIIGIIDTGIDYENSAFRDSSGRSRIISLWDQSIQSGEQPEIFKYGSEYTRENLNRALESDDPLNIVPSVDENGHGTYLAGLAAGSSDLQNDFTGAAPEAELVVVKLKQAKNIMRKIYNIPQDAVAFEENDIMAGVSYVNYIAAKAQKPVVFLIGVGTNSGSHSGTGPLASQLNFVAAELARVVVVAAGNEANRGHHYYGVIGEEEYDNMEVRVGPGEQGFTLEIWAETPEILSVGLVTPSGEEIQRIPAKRAFDNEYGFIFERTRVYVYYSFVELSSGAELIFLRFTMPSEGVWNIRVYGKSGNSYNAWLPIEGFVPDDTYFLNSNPDQTITEPGNAYYPITVTGYDYRNGSIYVNASRGNALPGFVKPDIAAPGVGITGPRSAYTLSEGARRQNRNQYMQMSGTSAAAAIAAGGAALVAEWAYVRRNAAYIDTIEMKSYFIRGAVTTPDLVYPNKIWGYGKLNIYNIFQNLQGN